MSEQPGLPPGNSRYRISNRLGSGGMGDVYAALDETLQRRVALKAIQAHRRLSAEARERFLREARILSQLDHPNICRAFDYVQGDDADWLVMELVEGRSLAEMLRAGPLGARVATIAQQIADVLVVTHAAGIVHRDLKPGNVMVTHTGEVKVLDFGIARSGASASASAEADARAAAETIADADLDQDGTRLSPAFSRATADLSAETSTSPDRPGSSTVGTLPYMSPEQARGELASSASDMFSFGLVLQEMLTGRRAYDTTVEPLALLARVRAGQTEPLDDGSELGALVRRMLSPAASQRPTAVDVVARLKWIADAPKRRLRRGLAAAAVIVAVLAGVKYTVDLRRERTIAIAAEADATRRRGQAEDLIGFMLGDLRPKLAKVGRLDLLDSVGAKAMDYFGAVPAASLSGEELSQRAQALYQIGDVRQQQGDLKAARSAFDQSLIAAEALASRDPQNADWQLRLATAHFYAGDIRRRENDLPGAMQAFSAYRDVAAKLSARDPNNSTWALEVAFAEGGVAAVQELMGDLASAEEALENALAVKERLAAADPKKAARQSDLAVGHNRLGVVLEKLGEPAQALSHYGKDLVIRRAMVAADPTNQTLKRPLFTATNFVATAYENSGDLKKALAQYLAAFEIISPLAATDRANVNWQRDVGVVERYLGGVLRASGRVAEARARYLHARAIQVPIAVKGPTDVTWQRDLAYTEVGLGYLELAGGNAAAARAAAASAVKLLTALFEKRPDNDTASVLMDAHLLAAETQARAGHSPAARESRERALAIAAAVKGTHSPRLRAQEARALADLGRVDAARTIVMELTRLGYLHWALDGTRRKIG